MSGSVVGCFVSSAANLFACMRGPGADTDTGMGHLCCLREKKLMGGYSNFYIGGV